MNIEKISFNSNEYILITNSVKGQNKVENQDSIKVFHDKNSIICCIADGLGSAPFSSEGSNLVVKIGNQILKEEIDSNFFKKLRDKWKEQIKNDYLLYDTTFKFIKLTENKIIYGSIGDGWIGIINGNKYISETVNHEFANNTDTILTDRINDKRIIKEISNNLDVALLATDGFSEDISKDNSDFLSDISNAIVDNLNTFTIELGRLMVNWPLKSNKDDKSLIILKKI